MDSSEKVISLFVDFKGKINVETIIFRKIPEFTLFLNEHIRSETRSRR